MRTAPALIGALICVLIGRALTLPGAEASFDYYLLALSYAPNFCAQPTGYKDPRQCGSGRALGFVVHGLWPQAETGRSPERCGPARPVSRDQLRVMLNYFPTESLIQHEWSMHGVCSDLSSAGYFAAVRKTRDSIAIPADLKQPSHPVTLSPVEIARKLAAANPSFPKEAFRLSCYRDGELQEIRVCFNKDLTPRACGPRGGQCRFQDVLLNPVR